MEINLQELYNDIRQRQPLAVGQVKPDMKIGVIYPDSIHIITVAVAGFYRKEIQEIIAVAKTMSGQSALNWEQDGTVHLMQRQDVSYYVDSADVYGWGVDFKPEQAVQDKLNQYGILEMIEQLPVVRISKVEKLAVWKQSPLEKLVDDNTNGEQTAENRRFYERGLQNL